MYLSCKYVPLTGFPDESENLKAKASAVMEITSTLKLFIQVKVLPLKVETIFATETSGKYVVPGVPKLATVKLV